MVRYRFFLVSHFDRFFLESKSGRTFPCQIGSPARSEVQVLSNLMPKKVLEEIKMRRLDAETGWVKPLVFFRG